MAHIATPIRAQVHVPQACLSELCRLERIPGLGSSCAGYGGVALQYRNKGLMISLEGIRSILSSSSRVLQQSDRRGPRIPTCPNALNPVPEVQVGQSVAGWKCRLQVSGHDRLGWLMDAGS